jgi:isoleucyl-tRNA synthetase
MGKWLENNVDWAISRERYWGTPLPIWRNEAGETMAIGSLTELEQLSGVKLEDPHRPYVDDVEIPSPSGGEPLRRVPEVIDVCFDSGAMPFAQWHAPHENEERFRERFPADYICEAIDQTRGWFYSLLAISTLLFDQSPYRTCLVLGHIADEQGRKMSKSLGNVVAPWDVIGQARGRRLPLVLLHLEVPVGRLHVLRRHGRRVAAPVPAPALEHVRLPRSLHERQRRA